MIYPRYIADHWETQDFNQGLTPKSLFIATNLGCLRPHACWSSLIFTVIDCHQDWDVEARGSDFVSKRSPRRRVPGDTRLLNEPDETPKCRFSSAFWEDSRHQFSPSFRLFGKCLTHPAVTSFGHLPCPPAQPPTL